MTAVFVITIAADQTEDLGAQIGNIARPGDVVCLTGDLGAGKTTLTKGIAAGLGVDRRAVVSPTFTILAEHPGGRLPLYHFDVYRLSGPADLVDIGFDDYLGAGGLIVIEWPERIAAALPTDRLDIVLSFPSPVQGNADLPPPFQEGIGKWSPELPTGIVETNQPGLGDQSRSISLTSTGSASLRLLEAIRL